METTNNKRDELEIDFGEIIAILLDRAAIIILISVICAAGMLIYTKFFVKPTYRSSISLYVRTTDQTAQSGMQAQQLQANTYLTTDAKQIIRGDYVLKQVIDELKLDMTCGELREMVTVTTPRDSRLITVSVTDTDPYLTKKILDSLVKYSRERITYLVGTEAIVDPKEDAKPGSQVGPNLKLNIILGFLAGFILSVIFFVATFLLDDTIKVQEDVEKYLGLSVLGLIPEIETGDVKKKKKKPVRK